LNGTDDQLNENLRQALSAHIREYGLLLRRGVTEELRAQAQQSVIRNPPGNQPGTQPKTNPPAPSADTEPTSTESEPAAEETEQ
jgi:hypothetical protein